MAEAYKGRHDPIDQHRQPEIRPARQGQRYLLEMPNPVRVVMEGTSAGLPRQDAREHGAATCDGPENIP